MRTLHFLFLLAAVAGTSSCGFTNSLIDLPHAPADGDAVDAAYPTGVVSSYQEGKAHFESRRFGLALDAFREALAEEDPPAVRTLNAIGACYDQLRRYDLAISFYEAALTMNPDAAQTLNNLAYSYILRSEWVRDERYLAKAQTYLSRAAELAPDNVIVLGNRQLLAERRGVREGVKTGTNFAVRQVEYSFVHPAQDPYEGWVERVRNGSYFLVTRPSEALADHLRNNRIDPSVASVRHAGQ